MAFTDWVISQIGQARLEMVAELRLDTSVGRLAKRSKTEIARHYRREHERMTIMRRRGKVGRIEFESWH